jgi:hypothetical protein
MGCFGSLQGKKSPVRRFFDVDCAKRNKLLALFDLSRFPTPLILRSSYTLVQEELDKIVEKINNCPRKILGCLTPYEVFSP